MAEFTFSQLQYVRPDFDQLEKECKIMVEEIKKAGSFSDIKAVIEKRDKLYGSLATMATIASI